MADEIARLIAEAEARERAEGYKPTSGQPKKKADMTFGNSQKKANFDTQIAEIRQVPRPKVIIEEDAVEFQSERELDYTRVRKEIRSRYKPRKGRGLSFNRPTIIHN